ncbi:MAG: hypothetical protein ACYDC1_23675, partial [Limisphaerales bacterium]
RATLFLNAFPDLAVGRLPATPAARSGRTELGQAADPARLSRQQSRMKGFEFWAEPAVALHGQLPRPSGRVMTTKTHPERQFLPVPPCLSGSFWSGSRHVSRANSYE